MVGVLGWGKPQDFLVAAKIPKLKPKRQKLANHYFFPLSAFPTPSLSPPQPPPLLLMRYNYETNKELK